MKRVSTFLQVIFFAIPIVCAQGTRRGLPLTRHSAHPPIADLRSVSRVARDSLWEDHFRGVYLQPVGDPGIAKSVENVVLTIYDTIIDQPAFPASDIGAIVTGRVLAASSSVATHGSYVYSDYAVQVTRVHWAGRRTNVFTAQTITASQMGGTVVFPSGHVTHFLVQGRGFPEAGRDYVFFLRKVDDSNEKLQIDRAYLLQDGKVFPLDDIPATVDFEGMTEGQFTTRMKLSIR